MRIVCMNAMLCSIFVGGRENAGVMNAVDSNDPNMYIRDMVAVFKLFAGAHPPIKIFSYHYHYVTA